MEAKVLNEEITKEAEPAREGRRPGQENNRQQGKETKLEDGGEGIEQNRRKLSLLSRPAGFLFLPCPWPSSECGEPALSAINLSPWKGVAPWELTVEPGLMMPNLSSSICWGDPNKREGLSAIGARTHTAQHPRPNGLCGCINSP